MPASAFGSGMIMGVDPGWEKVGYVAVAGLTEVGFSFAADLLMVVSHQGRGVVDVVTGAVIARDRDEPGVAGACRASTRGSGRLGRMLTSCSCRRPTVRLAERSEARAGEGPLSHPRFPSCFGHSPRGSLGSRGLGSAGQPNDEVR